MSSNHVFMRCKKRNRAEECILLVQWCFKPSNYFVNNLWFVHPDEHILLCANWIYNLLVICNVNESIIKCCILLYCLAYKIIVIIYPWCYLFSNAFFHFFVNLKREKIRFEAMGTLIDIMMLNRSDCVQTVGWWQMTDSKIEFGEDKKICNVIALLYIWLDVRFKNHIKGLFAVQQDSIDWE